MGIEASHSLECLERVLFDPASIGQRVRELGQVLAKDYAGRDLLLVGVLRGSAVFLADLTRSIPMPHGFDFVGLASYDGARSSGSVRLTNDLANEIAGRHVVVVEDIYDTGLSMSHVIPLLAERGPASLEICSLLYKNRTRENDLRIRYVGFRIPDVFVVGYGLDYKGLYRNLPCIGVLKRELYV